MKGLSFLTRCLSLIIVFSVAGTAAQLQAAPPGQKSDSPPAPLPFPRSNDTNPLPHQPGAVAPADAPRLVEAVTLYPYSRLTFQSLRNFTDWNVFVGSDDGSSQAQITFDPASDLHPRQNRGATRIAFASRRTGNYEIFTMNPDGSGLVQITFNGADDVQPAWSPDGTRLVFQAYRDGQPEVYVMNADGSGQVRLTNNGDYDGEPSWSPDGSKIAFVSKRTGGSGDYFIYIMNADGSGQTQLSVQLYSEGPVWSPDGTRIAYDSAGSDYWQNLWVMNADGSNQHVVFDEGGYADAWARSWSPDSRYIAFTRIYYVVQGGNLYWTYAYLDAWDSQTGGVIRLSQNGYDWRPDWQTTDALTPNSNVQTLSVQSPSPIPVRWSGTDSGSSGINTYDVQVRDGAGGTWTTWQTGTSATSGSYPGVSGHTYYFRARARDHAGNLEAYPANPDASTTVEALPPVGYVQPLPAYSKDSVLVTWSGTDPGGSGIQSYDVQYKDGAGGTWTNWQVGTTSLSAAFNGTAGHTYYFRARATDRAQNLGTYPPVEDAQTSFYVWGIAGTARDTTGVPVTGMTISTVPAGPETFNSDAAGDYAAYVLTNAGAYTATWAKPGYGPLPATAFAGPADANLNVVLPPEDDLLVNGHFEAVDLVSNGWQVSGALTPTLTNTIRHTGQQSVLLGIPVTSEVALSDDLVAYWNLDEGGGLRADATGRGNDLVDNNTVLSVTGKVGQAAQFVAANQESLSHPDNADLSTGNNDFTVAGWIYLDSKDGYRTIVSKWVGGDYEYLLRYDFFTYDRFTFEVSGNGTSGTIAIVPANSFGSPEPGQWYWVVGWYNSQNGTLNIQVNNGPVDSLAYGGSIHDGASNFSVGFVPGLYYHDGRVDEVGLWKRILTTEERLALYNTGQGCTYPFATCSSLQPTTPSGAGASTLAQVVTLPPTFTAPTLSFVYWPGRESPLTDGLVAYWALEESSGVRIDATGRGNDLADINTVTSGAGKVGQAAKFVAVNQEYLSRPDSVNLSAGNADFTVAGWIYLDSQDGFRTIASKWTINHYEYLLRYDTSRFTFEVSRNGTAGAITIVSANSLGAPTAGQWYWVVGWYDSHNSTLNIQVNNGPVDSLAYGAGIYDGQANFNVGFVPGSYYHDGRLDEIGLWKRVLTSAERSQLYNNGLGCTYPFMACADLLQPTPSAGANTSAVAQAVTLPPTLTTPVLSFGYRPEHASPLKDDLVAYWPLDEAGGARVDMTGRGNDLADNNTVGSSPGKVGNSAQFVAGNQEFLSHPDNADLSMGDIDFTISTWIYLTSPKTNGAALVKGNADTFNTFEYGWGYDGPNDRFGGSVVNSGIGASVPANNFGSPTAEQWYFVVFWHDATNNEIGISVNGIENVVPYSSGVWDTAFDFILGSDTCCRYLNGRLDEVGLWKRVLTPGERSALYNAGAGCTYPFSMCGPLTSAERGSPAGQFTVAVEDGLGTTTIFSDTALTASNWTHHGLDLSAWAGQTITISFTVEQGSGPVPAQVYLDEVTLGSAKPDVWATLDAPLSAQPGEAFVYQLTYGNQGGAIADGTYLTLTLPADFTYSSLSVPPVISTTTTLVWDVGSLAAQSGPSSIFVIAAVSPTATVPVTVTSTLTIAASSELETANNTWEIRTWLGYQLFFPIARRD